MGGRSEPPKRKCDRPKNLEVFLINFQIRYKALVAVLFPMSWVGGWLEGFQKVYEEVMIQDID